MNNQIMYCFDESLANDYIGQRLILLQKITIDNKPCWCFAVDDSNQLNFSEVDKNKVLFSNKLNF